MDSIAAASLSYTYDIADRISGIGYPSGRNVRYSYDGKGGVAGVETRASPTAAWVTLAGIISYQPVGAVESIALGNELIAANVRGQEGWLKQRSLTNVSSAATPVGTKYSDLSYVYDPDGNVTSIDDAITSKGLQLVLCSSAIDSVKIGKTR